MQRATDALLRFRLLCRSPRRDAAFARRYGYCGVLASMRPPLHNPSPACPCCGDEVRPWPPLTPLEPCMACKRPILVIPLPATLPRRVLVTGLLEAGSSLYGIATVCLMVAFVVSPGTGREFVKAFTLILFVIASVLAVDGTLGIRSGIDRTWRGVRRGTPARLLGVGKLCAAAAAWVLVLIGVTL